MVTSIESPTSIAIPITTAASTESLCGKFILSYLKTVQLRWAAHETKKCYSIVKQRTRFTCARLSVTKRFHKRR